MTFQFEDWMVHEYHQQGFLIFRGIVPPSLLTDLRREADRARALAHELNGPQTQRIQPLDRYEEYIDLQPFRDYAELDELRVTVERLLGPGYTHAHLDIMGLLVEPLERPWHCGWHRDGVVEVPAEARDAEMESFMATVWNDLRYFNQVNCAIYADACTWYVPGSHLRQQDLPDEVQSTGDPVMKEAPAEWSDAEAEQFYFEHCRSMPGAVQVYLGPGDFMVYRNLAWHCGMYLPYQPRATIHDIIRHTGRNSWMESWNKAKQAARGRSAAAGMS